MLPSPAEEVQPATGAVDTVLLCHHWISPLHFNNCLVQLIYQIWPQKTTEGSPDLLSESLVQSLLTLHELYLFRSEQKGWQNHSVPSHPAHSIFELLQSGRTLQSSEHQNDQTQKQFLPSGNPSHENLTINVEHATLLYITYSSHILIYISNVHMYLYTHTCLYCILCFCYFVHCLFVYYSFIICPVLSCPVAVILLHCGTSVSYNKFMYV